MSEDNFGNAIGKVIGDAIGKMFTEDEDAGSGINLLPDDDVHLRLVPGQLHELADHGGDDVLFDVVRKGDAGQVGDGKAVAFRNAHFQDISDLVKREAHDVKPASQVRDGCGREYTYAFHTVGEFAPS